MLGLDAAGKTTILYKLHIGEVLSTVPTIGMWCKAYAPAAVCCACKLAKVVNAGNLAQGCSNSLQPFA